MPQQDLNEKIGKKIAEWAPYLDSLPCVAIVHHIHDWNTLYMSVRGLRILNTTLQQLQEMGADYHRLYFNPEESQEYVPRLSAMLDRNIEGDMVTFFQQVRSSPEEDWHMWLSSISVFMRDDEGNPLLTLTLTVPVDPNHNISSKVERLLSENSFIRKNANAYSSLTRRELEIVALMAQDISSQEICSRLFVSEETIKTHRRNIKRKINAQNHYDVVRFAQAFGLI